MNCAKNILNILICTIALIALCEARGGRRGGSFGGLFGSWRKYKKPSTGSGSTRRIVSSSPVHTPITKALHENKKANGNDKYQKANNYYNSYNSPPLPAGGAYYQNTAALPGNAIYVAQPPPRGAEIGDFLTGYLTGRLLTMGFSPPYYHQVTHVYRDNPPLVPSDQHTNSTGAKVIVVNTQTEVAATEAPYTAPLETTATTETVAISRTARSTSTQQPLDTTQAPTTPPPYGVICIPMLLNESNDKGEQVAVERIICYPAPAPPLPQKDLKSKPVEIAGDIIES